MEGIDREVVDAMVRRLLLKLGDFLNEDHNLQTSMKKDLQSLERELRRIIDQLDRHDTRELSYDIENIVDNLLRRINEGSEPAITNQDYCLREMLEEIKAQVKIILAACSETGTVCLEDNTYREVTQLVGIHESRAKLISMMSSSSQRDVTPKEELKIVSICGQRGMGKTTLAKEVYEAIKGDFHYTAFVSVGPICDLKKVFMNILQDLGKERYMDLNMAILDERQLIDELRDFLESKRYLLVLDDIWEIESLERIKLSWASSGCGSRIIMTCRNLEVGMRSGGEVCELMPLTYDESEELFYATLFDRRGTASFEPLTERDTENVLLKCGGVPSAIVALANVLALKPQEEWLWVCDAIGFDEDHQVAMESILAFSYSELPTHLKQCFSYCAVFPRDDKIDKDELVWRWVAQGFVSEEQEAGESLFKVGERHFNDLINRGLIQPVENEDSEVIAGYRVDDVMFDVIHRDLKREVENRDLKREVEKFGSHDVERHPEVDGLRPCMQETMSKFQEFRVDLSLEGYSIGALRYSDVPRSLARLCHLRYLRLCGTHIRELPTEIGGLMLLQTLDLTDTSVEALPPSVTQLKQLRCLRWPAAAEMELPQGMGNLTLLEDLRLGTVANNSADVFAEELSKLTELRVLHVRIYTKYLGDMWKEVNLMGSLGKLRKIEELVVLWHGPGSDEPWRHVVGPGTFPKLLRLKMNTWVINQPGAMPCLKSLKLVVHVRGFKDLIHVGFDKLMYLRRLERARVAIICWGATMEETEEAEKALRRVCYKHPNHPKLFLERYGCCADEEHQQEDSDSYSYNTCWSDYPQRHVKNKQICSLITCPDKLPPQFMRMPLELLRRITRGFSEKRKLGAGAYGTVYKGVIDGQGIAVKLFHPFQQRDYEKEFKKEFENLARLNHQNIVKLFGYCYEIHREVAMHNGCNVLADKIYSAVCLEYMHNGSLKEHLDDDGLDWKARCRIIKGICEGLEYLHKGLESPMYHLDLKPENVLLDKNMVPKLADLGLSRVVCNNQTQTISSSLGTRGYCPPEYVDKNYVSNKFDIYSLGVVMIEMIAGRNGRCKLDEMPSEEFFIDYVQENWRKRLQETPGCTSLEYECHQVKRCTEIALYCVRPDRNQRPAIEDITRWLNETETDTEKMATSSTSQSET